MTTALASPVLVLNKHWSPASVTDARRALVLMFKGLAQAIDMGEAAMPNYDFADWHALSAHRAAFEADVDEHRWVKTVREPVLAPQVIRLVRYDRFRAPKVPLTRRNIFLRDENTCQYCGQRFSSTELSLDHVLPSSRGGGNTWQNLVCACTTCNHTKADRTPREAGMRLVRDPQPLRVLPNLPRVCPSSWQQFVDAAYWNVELRD